MQGIISVFGLVDVPGQFAPFVSLLITQLLVRNARYLSNRLSTYAHTYTYMVPGIDDSYLHLNPHMPNNPTTPSFIGHAAGIVAGGMHIIGMFDWLRSPYWALIWGLWIAGVCR